MNINPHSMEFIDYKYLKEIREDKRKFKVLSYNQQISFSWFGKWQSHLVVRTGKKTLSLLDR